MKITGPYNLRPSDVVKGKRTSQASSGGDFLGLISGGSEASESATVTATDAVPLTSLDAMLSLQEISDDELRRKKAVADGFDTLETLEDLRHSLLVGRVPEHVLRGLTLKVARQRQQISDPRLLAVLDDIELRAAVELAKLEMAQGQTTS